MRAPQSARIPVLPVCILPLLAPLSLPSAPVLHFIEAIAAVRASASFLMAPRFWPTSLCFNPPPPLLSLPPPAPPSPPLLSPRCVGHFYLNTPRQKGIAEYFSVDTVMSNTMVMEDTMESREKWLVRERVRRVLVLGSGRKGFNR